MKRIMGTMCIRTVPEPDYGLVYCKFLWKKSLQFTSHSVSCMKKIRLAARASVQPYFSSRRFRAASNQTERLDQTNFPKTLYRSVQVPSCCELSCELNREFPIDCFNTYWITVTAERMATIVVYASLLNSCQAVLNDMRDHCLVRGGKCKTRTESPSPDRSETSGNTRGKWNYISKSN